MPINILMPALSPTMEEGKLAKWLVKEGDSVTSGDVLAEIETDKATMEVEAIDDGVVGKIVVEEGAEGVKVNRTIAVLLEEGEDASVIDAALSSAAPPPPAAGTAPQPLLASGLAASTSPTGSQPNGHAGAATSAAATCRIIASPLARRLAASSGIDLASVSGSGPHGRIVKRDIEKAIARGAAPSGAAGGTAMTRAGPLTPASSPAGSAQATGTAMAAGTTMGSAGAMTTGALAGAMPDEQILSLYDAGSYELVPHDGMRRIIAQRLTQSKQTVPHFYLNMDCRLDELLRARKRMNDGAPKDGPRAYKLSVNDFIIKAMALALQDVPAANATWTEQGTLYHKASDVGVAVAVEGGLFTPVIRHADLKSLSEISNEMKDVAARARSKRLAPHEYQGGTTSISNLGMYGVKSFDAVINPPHATILAVGAGQEQATIIDGKVVAATIMSVTLSCDHRVVDGAIGAELLSAFKRFIEDPVRMLV